MENQRKWETLLKYGASAVSCFSRSTLLLSEDLHKLKHESVSESLSFSPNELNLIGCDKSCDIRIIWHHSMLSTRSNASISLVMSVKAFMASTQNSGSVLWKLYLILINSPASTINGFDPELPKCIMKVIPDFD